MIKFNQTNIPQKKGWYWVLFKGYKTPHPCWFMYSDELDSCCFLPGGMGDSSSNGVYLEDVEKIGPEIIVPNF